MSGSTAGMWASMTDNCEKSTEERNYCPCCGKPIRVDFIDGEIQAYHVEDTAVAHCGDCGAEYDTAQEAIDCECDSEQDVSEDSTTLEEAAWRCKLCDYASNNMHRLRSHARINHKDEYDESQHADGWYVDAIYEKTYRRSDLLELLTVRLAELRQNHDEAEDVEPKMLIGGGIQEIERMREEFVDEGDIG